MNILKNVEVPTGNILIVNSKYGKLECVSLGDYGKNVNVKADFLGLDRELIKVDHTDLLPLTDKWVITISTQYGCSMGCKFCDAPMVGNGRNVSEEDLLLQIKTAMTLHPEIDYSDRLNIHFARMGEPTWNDNVLDVARTLHHKMSEFNVHPVVSTMMPVQNKNLSDFIFDWMFIKNIVYDGNAGLQLSINSTNEAERGYMFNHNACTLEEIGYIMEDVMVPVGRKITLNFAIADYEIDPNILLDYFDPKYYLIKLTPMHKTIACSVRGILTKDDYTTFYPYAAIEQKLKAAGYDVIVFIASNEEDISKITCGHAILANQ